MEVFIVVFDRYKAVVGGVCLYSIIEFKFGNYKPWELLPLSMSFLEFSGNSQGDQFEISGILRTSILKE